MPVRHGLCFLLVSMRLWFPARPLLIAHRDVLKPAGCNVTYCADCGGRSQCCDRGVPRRSRASDTNSTTGRMISATTMNPTAIPIHIHGNDDYVQPGRSDAVVATAGHPRAAMQ